MATDQQSSTATADGGVDEGSPFARMPLVYERAACGPDTSNPGGMRADTFDAYGRVSIPNLQPGTGACRTT